MCVAVLNKGHPLDIAIFPPLPSESLPNSNSLVKMISTALLLSLAAPLASAAAVKRQAMDITVSNHQFT